MTLILPRRKLLRLGAGLIAAPAIIGLDRAIAQIPGVGIFPIGAPPIYATFNPSQNGGLTLSNGNLTATKANTGVNQYQNCYATIGKSAGKNYFEITLGALSGTVRLYIGQGNTFALTTFLGGFASSWGTANTAASGLSVDGVTNNWSGGSGNFATGQVLQFAIDMGAAVAYMGLNGTWLNSAVPASGTGYIVSGMSGLYYFGISANGLSGSQAVTANFGASAFTYSPPSGFAAGLY